MKKVEWIVLIIFILALLSIGAIAVFFVMQKPLVVSPTQDNRATENMSDWKMYSNVERGFAIEYPNTMEVRELIFPDDGLSIEFVRKNSKLSGPINIFVGKQIYIKGEGDRVIGNKNIGGIDTDVLRIFTGDVNSQCEKIVISKDEVYYTFSDNCGQDRELYEGIIETFKFTK